MDVFVTGSDGIMRPSVIGVWMIMVVGYVSSVVKVTEGVVTCEVSVLSLGA